MKELAKAEEPGSHPTKSLGLGDTIAKLTKLIGIKPCKGCQERRKRLNERFAYKK